ncbi:MAG: Zn-dependent alcohol dehydrogenase, partial [Acetobacteraceae bacterium]|nr:Zn-dependent alcohol dehydrogenase [Acetobacteraceae bacterium]
MKAAVFHAPHQPLTIEEVEHARPKRREVLLRTAFAGLCHSDLHFMEGLYPYPAPAVLGHEAAAVVEEVGEDVTYVRPGDHVITCLSVFCGECPQCLTGHTNLCENTEVKLMPGAARRLTWKGEVLNQAFNLSAFSEKMLVHEHAVVKINQEIPLDRAALVGCGVMTGVGAVFNAAKVEPGSTVAVVGCGGIGLSAVNGAALAGASRIIAIDTVPSKLDKAKEMGATDTINASNVDPVAAVKDMTEGQGVPYSFEAIGLKRTAEQCFEMLRPGGVATIIGMIPFGTKIELHGADFLRDRKIQGTSM